MRILSLKSQVGFRLSLPHLTCITGQNHHLPGPWMSLLSVARINAMTKSNLGRKRLISPKGPISSCCLVHHEGKSRQKLKAGTKAEAIELRACWFAPHGLLTLLSYRTQDHLSRGGATHNEVDISTPIINQENALQGYLLASRLKDFFLTDLLSSHIVLACIKLTKQ